MIGIIGAMEEEIQILKGKIKDLKQEKIAHTVFYQGKLENQEVVLIQSGIGKVNVAIATALLIQQYHPDYIINTGSAGALQGGLALGDVVISTEVSHHDADARAFGYQMGQIPGMPARYQADNYLYQKVEEALHAIDAQIVEGLIVSGDSFIGTDVQRQAILEHFPEAIAAEMEAAAIAQTCYQFNVPFIITRAISDLADEEANMTFDAFLTVASKSSSEMVMKLIKLL
ncbi:5'-methylthioadenosine/S-adenosylhomocysteine nucleosidase [Staphylococcus canis]|uniref:5'-methylthioadenosine/S-adenosylhomocysteine nucleosidase n=1 Tax=Staphylococcus canis TaxID=2724942 RepID=A0ABS0TAS5_9STAP|nr:5'-methylthioadenosine/S-adenosylhomocysteine nucleosidase [Staphylococcus canis]MBI5975777.1 5'-methylthioadenosine/S-adenosylhomocysteine nucleosidase [Staphylococcus canis]